MIAPRHVDPNIRGYTEYFDHLLAFNTANQDRVIDELRKHLAPFEGEEYCIATTGSDGRLEKGPVSLVEIVLMREKQEEDDEILATVQTIADSDPDKFETCVEVKYTDEGTMSEANLYSAKSDKSFTLLSPNRLLDARLLFGDKYILRSAHKKLVAETAGKEGKSRINKIRSSLRTHRNITTSGTQQFKGEELCHYDLEEGIAHYDPERSVWAFKQGPLRAVQYAIVASTLKEFRAGRDPKTLFRLNKNTVLKLNQLEVQDLSGLTAQEMGDLTDCYKYFLWLYHRAQVAYSEKGLTTTAFNSKETAERCNSIAEICGKPIIIPYSK